MSHAVPSSAAVSARMSRQGSRDTAPEVAVRRLLHAAGMRYRVNVPVPGMPRRTIDIVFGRAKVAVFMDGCFWHGCPEHATRPKANAEWWRAKLDKNMARDLETTRHLRSAGWTVLRFWEHEPVTDVARHIGETVTTARTPPTEPPKDEVGIERDTTLGTCNDPTR
ncbi:very short patch repair endonuclease [Streptomyces bauhiniae]